jgi:formylglycine-generating enzyme required for sulfatase activity
MKKLIIILFLLLTACSGNRAAPTVTSLPPTLAPSDTPTITPSPTLTSTPTSTNTPTITPDPNLLVDEKGVSMRLVPEGEFTMGISVEDGMALCAKYRPGTCPRFWYEGMEVHQVFLDAFYMDTYEVTNGLYQACVTEGVCTPPQKTSSLTHAEYYGNPEYDNYPVIYVNWDQAKAFCAWRGASLPTEAQWEKGARGTQANLYPWGNRLEDGKTNSCINNCLNQGFVYQLPDDGYADVAPVGSFATDISPYGIYDMAGNVAEWTANYYSETYMRSPAASEPNPTGPASGRDIVAKGGHIELPPELMHSPQVLPINPGNAWYFYGLRCALNGNP